MKITLADLNHISDESRKFFIDRSCELKLLDEGTPLTESQRIALGWLDSTLTVYLKYGIITKENLEFAKVQLEIPSSESTFDE